MLLIVSASGETKIKFNKERDGMLSMSSRKSCVSGVLSREDAAMLGKALLAWGEAFSKKKEEEATEATSD